MDRYEYPIKNTPALYILICTYGGINRNQQSNNDNSGGRGGRQEKGRMVQNFDLQ